MFLSPVTESAQSIHDTTNPLHKPPRRHRFASCRLDTDDILGRSSRVTAISLSSRERCCSWNTTAVMCLLVLDLSLRLWSQQKIKSPIINIASTQLTFQLLLHCWRENTEVLGRDQNKPSDSDCILVVAADDTATDSCAVIFHYWKAR